MLRNSNETRDLGIIIDNNIVNSSDHLPIGCNIILDDKLKFNPPARGKQCRYKRRWNKADLAKYYSNTYVLLQHKCNVSHCVHWDLINEYYNAIVTALEFCYGGLCAIV